MCVWCLLNQDQRWRDSEGKLMAKVYRAGGEEWLKDEAERHLKHIEEVRSRPCGGYTGGSGRTS